MLSAIVLFAVTRKKKSEGLRVSFWQRYPHLRDVLLVFEEGFHVIFMDAFSVREHAVRTVLSDDAFLV